MTRVYAYSGESGENICIEGEPSEFEKTLNLMNTFSKEAGDPKYFERTDIKWPDEEFVMKIASHWSIDPSELESRTTITGLGLLGDH